MTIRSVTDADLPAIMAFWNPLIRDTAVTFSSEERTVPSLQRMIAERQAAGRAFLVAEAAGRPVGLATYDRFRASNGYAHTMEHTIILSPDAQGRGLGRALMAAIEDHARRAGAHSMIAAVSAENRAGEAFHRALGYALVGRLPDAGRKFGRWMDLLLLQKIL